jgi:hypothetical protein
VRSLWHLLGLGLIGYLGLAAYMYLFQESYVFFPSRVLAAHPGDAGLSHDEVHFQATDGTRLHGWFVPAAGGQLTVLFLHGNAGNIGHRLDSLRIFNRLGLSTFIFDYRGYGRSDGRPSEEGTYRDAQGAWRYLVEVRGVPADRVVFFGRSLGCAVATWLATRHPPRALIIESCFTSVPELARLYYPLLPVRLLARIRYDTLQRIQEVRAPVLVVHSQADEIVPFDHGRRVFQAAGEPKVFLPIEGSHNDGFLQSGQHYVAGLERFLGSVQAGHQPPAAGSAGP